MANRVCGGSDCERYIACAAAQMLGDKYPKVSSVYADRGTELHKQVETVAEAPEAIAVQEWIQNKLIDNGYHVTQEVQVAFGGDGEYQGTADILFTHDSKIEGIVDPKFGYKIVPADTKQLLFYLTGAVRQGLIKPAERYLVAILQIVDGDLEVDKKIYSHDDIQKFEATMAIAKELHDEFGALVAADPQRLFDTRYYSEGPHCDFCSAYSGCPTKLDKIPQILDADEHLTPVELLSLLNQIKPWVTKTKKYLDTLAKSDYAKGLIRAACKTKKTFKDEQKIKRDLLTDGFTEDEICDRNGKLKSVAQICKIAKIEDDEIKTEVTAYKTIADKNIDDEKVISKLTNILKR